MASAKPGFGASFWAVRETYRLIDPITVSKAIFHHRPEFIDDVNTFLRDA